MFFLCVLTFKLSNIFCLIPEGGGSDPKFNSQLRRAIEKAKAADVPNTTIENAIKQAVGYNSSDLGPVQVIYLIFLSYFIM